MAFRVSPKALARLEWPDLVARLRRHACTPEARRRLEEDRAGELFEADPAGVAERLAETREARALVEAGELPPLGGVPDLADSLSRLAREGTLAASELFGLAALLAAFRSSAGFLARRSESAPGLAELAEGLIDLGELEDEIRLSLDAEGELRDDASPALAEARREARQLAGEVQRRIGRYLQDPDVAAALSDSFFTVRGDRYVLPVRADARGRVPGIVHDASASGTTLFVEPEALVDLNNRLKQAELDAERESRRILRALSGQAASEREAIGANLERLAQIDLAFARGRLAVDMDGVEPEVGDAGILHLPQLRHPLVPDDEVVPNDLHLGRGAREGPEAGARVLVISGPNAGGKTVALKAVALAALCVRAGLQVPAAAGSRLDRVDSLLADIGDEQDIREHLSTFSAHMANLSRIVSEADARSLVVLDEVGVGTDPGEGAALAQAVLESLAEAGARVVTTTHYNLLKEMAEVDERFENASVDFDPETLAPTYRLRMGAAGASSATAVAARMGMPSRVLERAASLLDREDRQLDRMLAELSASRASLERERSEVAALRAESESSRDAYRHKLERLQSRRDQLFASMRSDLDRAFQEAHREVAQVIRELQRGGSAQAAARARDKLLALEQDARAPAAEEPAPAPRVDWQRIEAGAEVQVPGGRRGVLLALPDRRGRVSVQVGGAKLSVPADRVAAVPGGAPPRKPSRPPPAALPAAMPDGGSASCDLRGLRVDDAIDQLIAALDEALAQDRSELRVIHGLGTGALLRAVRSHLKESPLVESFAAGGAEGGGDGVTVATLRD